MHCNNWEKHVDEHCLQIMLQGLLSMLITSTLKVIHTRLGSGFRTSPFCRTGSWSGRVITNEGVNQCFGKSNKNDSIHNMRIDCCCCCFTRVTYVACWWCLRVIACHCHCHCRSGPSDRPKPNHTKRSWTKPLKAWSSLGYPIRGEAH